MDDQGEWIGALEAAHLLAPHVGGDRAAKKALTERLRDGAIQSRAAWMAMAIDVGRPYVMTPICFELNEGEPVPTVTRHQLHQHFKPTISHTRYGDGLAFSVNKVGVIGQAFWSGASKLDVKRWDWSQGFFLVSYDPRTWKQDAIPEALSEKFPMRMFVLGAEFSRADIHRIIGSADVMLPPVKSESRGRKLSERFPDWIAAVVSLQSEGRLEGLTATKLMVVVADYLAESGKFCPADATVRSAAHAIVEALNPPLAIRKR